MDPVTIAIISGLVALFGWGFADVFAKKGIDEVGKYKPIYYSNLVRIVLTVPLLLFVKGSIELSFQTFIALFIFSFVDLAGYFLLYKAYEIGKLSIINPITSTYAILVSIVSFLFFGESFPPLKILSIVIVMLGVIFTAVDFKELKDGFQYKDISKGVPIAFLLFFVYGIFYPYWDAFIEGQNWVVLSILSSIMFQLLFLLYFRYFKKIPLKVKDRKILTYLITIGVLESVALAFSNWGLSASDQTSLTAAISSAVPLVTVLSARFFLNEKVSRNQYFGVVLIVGGVCVSMLL